MSRGQEEGRAGASPPGRLAWVFSVLLVATLVVQAAGGLFLRGLYRDNAWVVSVFKGTDLEALVLDVPVLLAALVAAMRGSARARLVLLGMLYYVFYNNMYYLFSAFNRFFLVYVALCVLSSCALVALLMGTDVERVDGTERGAGRKAVGVVLFANAAILAVMWIGQAVLFIADGRLPQLILDTGGATHVVAVLDLTLVVPPLVLAGVWLWRGRPWGRVLATAMLVQGTAITVDLFATPPFQAAAGVKDAWAMVPLWVVMGAMFLLSSVYMLRSTRTAA